MTDAYSAIQIHTELWLADFVAEHHQYNDEYVIEMARCLDRYAIMPVPENAELRRKRGDILRGHAILLSSLLNVSHADDALPRSKPRVSWLRSRVERDLEDAGKLFRMRAFVGLAREEVVQVSELAERHYAVKPLVANTERFEREDEEWIVAHNRKKSAAKLRSLQIAITSRFNDINIFDYIRLKSNELEIYAFDDDLFSLTKEIISYRWTEYSEAWSFPDHAMIGGHTFGFWRNICITAATNIEIYHQYIEILKIKKLISSLEAKKLRTRIIPVEKLEETFFSSLVRQDAFDYDAACRAFLICAATAKSQFDEWECPSPYGIVIGERVIVSYFGLRSNLTSSLIYFLRNNYRRDWDAATNLREAFFQDEIEKLLDDRYFKIDKRNVNFSSSLGASDTDGAIYEKDSNTVFILQIKCLDIWADNINQRRNRLTNMALANDWIRKTHAWIAETLCEELVEQLGFTTVISQIQTLRFKLLIASQFDTRISSNVVQYDRSAAWVSWNRMQRLYLESRTQHVALSEIHKICSIPDDLSPTNNLRSEEFALKYIRVDIIN